MAKDEVVPNLSIQLISFVTGLPIVSHRFPYKRKSLEAQDFVLKIKIKAVCCVKKKSMSTPFVQ